MKKIFKFKKVLATFFATTGFVSNGLHIFSMENKKEKNESWVKPFNTKLISEDQLKNVLVHFKNDLLSKIKGNNKGIFLNQKKDSYEGIIFNGSDKIHYLSSKGLSDIRNEEIHAIFNYVAARRVSENKAKYEILASKLNNCQTRCSIFLKHLNDMKKGIFAQLLLTKHTIPIVVTKEGYTKSLDYYNDIASPLAESVFDFNYINRESRPALVCLDDRDTNNNCVSFGIWFLTLQKYLNEKAENQRMKEKFRINSVLCFNDSLPFSLLPVIEINDEKVQCLYNGKKTIPLILLSQSENSLLGIGTDDIYLAVYTQTPDSHYSMEILDHIVNSCIDGKFSVSKNSSAETLWKFLEKILAAFPKSKVLYVDKDSYENKNGDFFMESKKASEWIQHPVDGKFVLHSESLQKYIIDLLEEYT